MTTKLRFYPAHQYDQAGLMVRISPQCWLKTSVEFEKDEPNKLGVVVTNHGFSDWSTQDFPDEHHELMLSVLRKNGDYLVRFRLAEQQSWTQIRMLHLHQDDGTKPLLCGLYTCCPIDAGYRVEFDFLSIEK